MKSQRGADVAAIGGGSPSCTAYCLSGNCEWTAQYSCPWAKTAGTQGRAGDDGSKGYECCCMARTGAGQPCGGNGSAIAAGSVQFTAFVTPSKETVLQVSVH